MKTIESANIIDPDEALIKPALCVTSYHKAWMKPFLKFWGWSGGAMVLGKLPVPGGPTYLDFGAGGGCLDIFSLVYHLSFFLPLSGRRPDIDCNTVSKGR